MIFTRFHLPNGRRTQETIERSSEIEALAAELVKAGCRLEVETLRSGLVSLAVEGPDEDITLAMSIIANGDGVPVAVDGLIREATKALSRAPLCSRAEDDGCIQFAADGCDGLCEWHHERAGERQDARDLEAR